MEKTPIDTINMVRQIRDRHAEILKGKSHKEIMEFFHKETVLSPPHRAHPDVAADYSGPQNLDNFC